MITTGFDSIVDELKRHLDQSVFVTNEEVERCPSFRSKLDGILSEPKKRNGRTDEAIMGDIMTGTVAEVGVAKLFGVSVFDAVFDLKDRSTFSQDIVYKGIRIEVKSHRHLRRFSVVNHSYHTMMNSWRERAFDVVLFAHTERCGEERGHLWKVTPTLIVDPFYDQSVVPFWDLWEQDDFSHVYRADQAVKRNLCYPLIELDT